MDDEPESVRCDECYLSFYVIADNDEFIMRGQKFQNYCPRCGGMMNDADELWQ